MFHYFKIPYFTCNVFTKFTYNEYIGPYFLSHVVLRFSPSDLPGVSTFRYCWLLQKTKSKKNVFQKSTIFDVNYTSLRICYTLTWDVMNDSISSLNVYDLGTWTWLHIASVRYTTLIWLLFLLTHLYFSNIKI